MRAARRVTAGVMVLAVFAASALAQATPPDSTIARETRALASELRCPVCQGLSLEASPSELALQMRSLIHDQLVAGRTPDQVKQYFVQKYGEWILLEPKATGFNLIVYALPALAIVGGLIVIWRFVKRSMRAPPTEDHAVT